MPNTLDQVVCLMLDITLWTGRKKLELTDLKDVDRSQIPPDKLATLGSKRIVDQDKLKIFNTLKKRAERACKSIGSRFLGGYAIPESRLNTLVDELEEIREEFALAQQEFIKSYDDNVEDWIRENPEWEESIRSAKDPISVIQRRISYSYQAFKIGELGGNFALEAQKGLKEAVSGLGSQLLYEIRQQASDAWDQSYAGKTEVGQKALRPLVAMAEKLEGLSFLDSRVSVMAQTVRNCLQTLPKTGRISGQHFNAVAGVISMLQDPRSLIRQTPQSWILPSTPPLTVGKEKDSQTPEPVKAPSQNKEPEIQVPLTEVREESGIPSVCTW